MLDTWIAEGVSKVVDQVSAGVKQMRNVFTGYENGVRIFVSVLWFMKLIFSIARA